jgi:CheY-like chemotaxis protein
MTETTTANLLSAIPVIEDNEDHLTLTLDALEDAGLRNPIHSAASLREARAYLEECTLRARQHEDGRLCMILLDMRLPDGSGTDLLREIRQNSPLSAVPVVVLTSSDHTPDIQRAYEMGANSYLVKPISFEEFHRKVREAGLYWAVLNEPYQQTPGSRDR